MVNVSYAQNFEDIMLSRALKNVKEGFYIDVGAWSPDFDNVTKHFYQQGWKGINIEPNNDFYNELCSKRYRDINLNAALGEKPGKSIMSFVDNPGLSTLNEEVAEFYKEKGREITEKEVTVLTLKQVCEKYISSEKEIHFLKVDVEGLEEKVLNGNDWHLYRPWIVVVEAVSPLTNKENYKDWEYILLSANYTFCYADGLNRFYVANEHCKLFDAFKYPPNVFDEFILAVANDFAEYRLKAEKDIENSEDLIKNLKSRLIDSENNIEEVKKRAIRAEGLYSSVLISKSWRITYPLRVINKINLDVGGKLWVKMKYLIKKYIISVVDLVIALPKLNGFIRYLLNHFPKVKKNIRRIYLARYAIENSPVVKFSDAVIKDRDIRLSKTTPYKLPLPIGKRIIYFYVDHTAIYPSQTGVQRVARCLANSLSSNGEKVRYVKWHDDTKQCVYINSEERKQLALFNGPAFTDIEQNLYLPPSQPLVPVEQAQGGENHWLIVPEVPYINVHGKAVTLDLLMWSKRTKLNSGFIFYDAIPLRRTEFDNVLDQHSQYMQHLLLADAVWPITKWSASDLKAYWEKEQLASQKTTPAIESIVLPGESVISDRILEINPSQKYILSVGSIEERKNQTTLIRSFLTYCHKKPNIEWRLILVGHIHESVQNEVVNLCQSPIVEHYGYVSDEKLLELYSNCSFTVFPSVEEGYGLPIMESLWLGKPCICADFGSMAEVARDGGCLTLDTRDVNALQKGVEKLIEDDSFRLKLTEEAINRPLKTWSDYASEVSNYLGREGQPAQKIGVVYYWIDSTLEYHKNTGIQRVTRQLAKSLLDIGAKLVPVKWGDSDQPIVYVSQDELKFFAKWTGPESKKWTSWIDPADVQNGWFFMPELPANHSAEKRNLILKFARHYNLHCASIFFDAIPWKMRSIYPTEAAQIHREYMLELNKYDLVLPISHFSQKDLIDFLGSELNRPQSLEQKIKTVSLAGELSESPRLLSHSESSDKTIRIACIGTVEPRKNHELLIRAFSDASQKLASSSVTLQLIIAGGSQSFDPTLAGKIRTMVDAHPNVFWEEYADDIRLKEIYAISDFSVYPSVEEGFGLPIVESLWNARPCICANFGAMYEVAEGGGCLNVDVRDVAALSTAIMQLATEPQLLNELAEQAITRQFKSWNDYATEVAMQMFGMHSMFPESSFQPLPLEELGKRTSKMRLGRNIKLSVCISTYNRAAWLAVALRNWTQNYPEPVDLVEFVVCDNASTDQTSEVIKPYLVRSDFAYYCNQENVGMLGNLRETAHHASGQYIWILGDDDLILPGSIERVLSVINDHPEVALVYLNYAFSREEAASNVKDFSLFYDKATPIIPAEPDLKGPICTIAGRNENFFTAIYTLVFRRDHALQAYSQDTSGRPFSSMLTCIPTTHYVLNHMMDEFGVWIGTPQLVINMNVSWMKYASLWILERLPEAYEVAEQFGAPVDQVDCWRVKYLDSVVHYFEEIFYDEEADNAKYFRADRLVRRIKHLSEYDAVKGSLKHIYHRAHIEGHPAALASPEKVFAES